MLISDVKCLRITRWEYDRYFKNIHQCCKSCARIDTVDYPLPGMNFPFCVSVSVRCWCARENKPHFQRREERTCGDLQWLKALLRKHFPRTDCSCEWSVVVFAEKARRTWLRTLTESKLHYSWTVLILSFHIWETNKRWAKLLALQSGTLLLERKNVSLILELWLPLGPYLWRIYFRLRGTIEWMVFLLLFSSTCICTNFNFLKTFFWSLNFCHIVYLLIKGNYLQGHFWETMLGSVFVTECCRICSFGDGLPWIT